MNDNRRGLSNYLWAAAVLLLLPFFVVRDRINDWRCRDCHGCQRAAFWPRKLCPDCADRHPSAIPVWRAFAITAAAVAAAYVLRLAADQLGWI